MVFFRVSGQTAALRVSAGSEEECWEPPFTFALCCPISPMNSNAALLPLDDVVVDIPALQAAFRVLSEPLHPNEMMTPDSPGSKRNP